MAHLLLYAGTDKVGNRLRQHIKKATIDRSIETIRTVKRLADRLRNPAGDIGLVLILTTTQDEFSKIFRIGDLLRDIKMILILPDRNPETIADAFKLYPRLIGYADEDFTDVVAVVSHILGRLYID